MHSRLIRRALGVALAVALLLVGAQVVAAGEEEAKPEPAKTEAGQGEAAEAEAAAQKEPAAQAGPVGAIKELKGRATAEAPDGTRRNLKEKEAVSLGETLRTGRGTKMEIAFQDGTVIALGPKAKLTIDKYLFKKKDAKSHCETTLSRGAFRVVSGAIGKLAPDAVKVKTPTATIGIRGTACVGEADTKKTLAIYTEGEAISVTNDKGQTILKGKAGMGCETLKGQPPGPAKLYKLEEVNRLRNMVIQSIVRNAATAGQHGGVGHAAPPVPHHHH